MSYDVRFWDDYPNSDNAECWDHDTFEDKAEAIAFANRKVHISYRADTRFIEIDGDDGYHKIIENPDYRPDSGYDDWRAEQAMQAGMAFGCDGYNDYYG